MHRKLTHYLLGKWTGISNKKWLTHTSNTHKSNMFLKFDTQYKQKRDYSIGRPFIWSLGSENRPNPDLWRQSRENKYDNVCLFMKVTSIPTYVSSTQTILTLTYILTTSYLISFLPWTYNFKCWILLFRILVINNC